MDYQEDLTAWMDRLKDRPVLPKEVVLDIAKRIQALDENSPKRKKLINKLVLHNMRLVVAFVKRYMDAKCARKWGSTETVDFLQVGLFGLFRAAEKYDPSLGYAFSTYANFWIRSFVNRYALKTTSIFKVSEDVYRKAYAYERYGRFNVSDNVNAQWRDDPEAACQLLRAAQSPLSIDSIDECGSTLADIIPDNKETVRFHEGAFEPAIENAIAVAKLAPQEDIVIRSLFLNNQKPFEIRRMHGISSAEYEKIKNSAFRKLKSTMKAAKMAV